MDEHVEGINEITNAYRNLIVRYETKRTLGRPKRRWDNCKLHVK
jgi:allophanate hydrolase subunit 1